MDSQNVQTIVDRYITSLRDRKTQYAVTKRFAKNPSEASRAEIEHDLTSWYFGFVSGIKLLDQKAMLPPLETVLGAALEKFERRLHQEFIRRWRRNEPRDVSVP